jgi:hypothetical protein
LFTVEVLSPGTDSRCFAWEEKDSRPGGGTLTAWVWCCCRWLSWLRTGDGSGWDLKSTKYRKKKKASINYSLTKVLNSLYTFLFTKVHSIITRFFFFFFFFFSILGFELRASLVNHYMFLWIVYLNLLRKEIYNWQLERMPK